MATTYCTRLDVESILSAPAVLALIDDDGDGNESPGESQFVTDAIERAAVKLNGQIGRQYKLEDVTDNDWMKWANAVLAAALLSKRRNNPLPESIHADVQEINELANEIAWGRRSLPEQAPSVEHIPAVTNFRPELGHGYAPVRVSTQESTGASPEGDRKRNISSPIYPY